MLIYKTRIFSKWATKEGMSDNALKNAINEMNQGLIDANLGGYVYKKRIGIKGKGKSGSTRTLIAYRFEDKAFFIYGFVKNERDNITNKELQALKLLAVELLNYSHQKIQDAINSGELNEVK